MCQSPFLSYFNEIDIVKTQDLNICINAFTIVIVNKYITHISESLSSSPRVHNFTCETILLRMRKSSVYFPCDIP